MLEGDKKSDEGRERKEGGRVEGVSGAVKFNYSGFYLELGEELRFEH